MAERKLSANAIRVLRVFSMPSSKGVRGGAPTGQSQRHKGSSCGYQAAFRDGPGDLSRATPSEGAEPHGCSSLGMTKRPTTTTTALNATLKSVRFEISVDKNPLFDRLFALKFRTEWVL